MPSPFVTSCSRMLPVGLALAATVVFASVQPGAAAPHRSARSRLACSVAAPASPTGPPLLALATFDSAWAIIHAAHFDTTFNGVDWSAVREELRPRAAAARDLDALRTVIRDMLARLRQSHFSLIPREVSPPDGSAIPESAGGDVGIAIRVMGDRAVVISVEPKSPAARAGLAPGWTLDVVDDCAVGELLGVIGDDALTSRAGRLRARALIERRLDGPVGDAVHLKMIDAGGSPRDFTLRREPPRGEVVRFGNLPPMVADVTVRAIQGAPGLDLALIQFDAWLPTLAARIDAAVGQHRAADGIVLDLRGNPGGVGAMVSGVAGHFVNEAHLLGILRMRGSELRFIANPRRVDAHGTRVEPLSVPLAILVDEETGSTSEMFAGALQQLGRARIFGDTTAGQVLPAIAQRLPNGDVLYHAVADFELPDGTRLEGRGVIPDEAAPATRADLLAGRDPALDAAVRWLAAQARRPD